MRADLLGAPYLRGIKGTHWAHAIEKSGRGSLRPVDPTSVRRLPCVMADDP